jgi:hypothetical protein
MKIANGVMSPEGEKVIHASHAIKKNGNKCAVPDLIILEFSFFNQTIKTRWPITES